jgi:hypothetical protein
MNEIEQALMPESASGNADWQEVLINGLEAEKQQARKLGMVHGRRIALEGLLLQRRPDGLPVWAMVDPMHPMSSVWSTGNGEITVFERTSGFFKQRIELVIVYAVYGRRVEVRKLLQDGGTSNYDIRNRKTLTAEGFPRLPDRVRALAVDPDVRNAAEFVAVLFKPKEWHLLPAKADPALIVEWKDRPKEYYALAVWGGDGAGIREFYK